MRAKETIRDISTSSLRLTQHQQLLAELEAREEKYNHVVQLGQSLLQDEETESKEVIETHLSSVTHIQLHQCNYHSILYRDASIQMCVYTHTCITYICLSVLSSLGTKTPVPFPTSAADECWHLLRACLQQSWAYSRSLLCSEQWR